MAGPIRRARGSPSAGRGGRVGRTPPADRVDQHQRAASFEGSRGRRPLGGTQARQGGRLSADPASGYAHEHRPLRGYSILTAAFGTAAGVGLLAARRRRGGLPARYGVWDLITVGAASHKLSRLIAKDRVTSFIRAPFVRYQESAGHGELDEEPRGEGLRLATGELLVCPYCLGQWIAAAFGVGLVGAPELTRLIAFVYTAETASDFLQLAYKAAEDATSS